MFVAWLGFFAAAIAFAFPIDPGTVLGYTFWFGGKMMSTSRSLDVLEGDRSREWRSYRQLGNPECREETSGSGPIDYHNQFVEIYD